MGEKTGRTGTLRNTRGRFRCMLVAALCAGSFGVFLPSLSARPEGAQTVLPPELADPGHLEALNKAVQEVNFLDYFDAREQLGGYSYEVLVALQKELVSRGMYPQLHALVGAVVVQKSKESLLALVETNFVDNVPTFDERPFYTLTSHGQSVTALRPESEYLYFPNLKLSYRKNILEKKSDELWVNPQLRREKEPGFSRAADHGGACAALGGSLRTLGSFSVAQPHKSDFIFGYRQWFKAYEENGLFPVLYRGNVLLRNEHRLFCVDPSSGKELWSLGDINGDGEEYYQTLYHPHHNAIGSELTVSGDAVYTELNGTFAAISLKDMRLPAVLWKKALGEYTLCTRPLVSGTVVVAGLVNARGEVWACGFDIRTGVIVWNTYIGLSSFVSPVCTISAESQGRIFLATNRSLLIALDAAKGTIAWVRTYKPREYTLYQLWRSEAHKLRREGKGFLRYDTQSIAVCDGAVYYKPRESASFYVLDAADGTLIRRIPIDSERFYLVGAWESHAAFLEHGNDNNCLFVCDMKTGSLLYSWEIGAGDLRGVVRGSDTQFIFKLGDALHEIDLSQGKEGYRTSPCTAPGWLVGGQERFLFTGDGSTLTILESAPVASEDQEGAEFSEQKKILEVLQRLVSRDADPSAQKEYAWLLDRLHQGPFPVREVAQEVAASRERMNSSGWGPFFSLLGKRYGNEVVTYREVSLRLRYLLAGLGFPGTEALATGSVGQKTAADRKRPYQVEAERLFLLPVKVIKGAGALDFYLLMNYDQLLCVDESGTIRWSKKLFNVSPYTELDLSVDFETILNKGRMDADDLQAYLYDDVLIFNDHGNIVALESGDGGYRWSMTTPDDVFNKEILLPPDNPDPLYTKYGVSRSYLSTVAFQSGFLGDQLVLTHGARIYSLDPRTGYCRRQGTMRTAVAEMTVADGLVYALSDDCTQVNVLDGDLAVVKTYPLDFIPDKNILPELTVLTRGLAVRAGTGLYILDKQDGSVRGALRLEKDNRCSVEAVADDLLVVVPLKRAALYTIAADGSLQKRWEAELGDPGVDVFWQVPDKDNRYYSIVGEQLIMLGKEGCTYAMHTFDLASGRELWVSPLEGLRGLLYYISPSVAVNDTVVFFISTACSRDCPDGLAACQKADIVNLDSRMIGLAVQGGALTRTEALPVTVANTDIRYIDGFENSSFAFTRNYFIYTVQANILRAELTNE